MRSSLPEVQTLINLRPKDLTGITSVRASQGPGEKQAAEDLGGRTSGGSSFPLEFGFPCVSTAQEVPFEMLHSEHGATEEELEASTF